jgi:hypothetical protein
MIVRLLLTALLVMAAAQHAVAEKRVALVIGNSKYANLPPIDKVLNDARTLREALSATLGFEVIYGENLDRREMNRKINELESKIEPGDIVFTYYGGHAVSLDGENFMLPVDLQKPEPGEEKFIIGDSIGVQAMTQRLQVKEARATFAILDASRNNPLDIGLETGLDKIDIAEGVFVLYAAGHGKASLNTLSDTDENPNSVFMRNLIPLLKTPGLTQVDLGEKVRAQVSAAASATGHEQVPEFENRIKDLISLNGGSGELVVQSEPPAGGSSPSVGSSSNALEEWKIVKASGNREALEGFRAKYGDDPVWGPLVDQELNKRGAKPQRKTVVVEEPEAEEIEEKREVKPLYRDLQTELRRVGCYTGAVDGTWGLSSRRALAQFSRRTGRPLRADDEALEELLGSDSGICRQTVSRAPPTVRKEAPVRRAAPVKRRVVAKRSPVRQQSSTACWSCTTYSYDTERVCVPRSVGNPSMRIPNLIRCRRN